MTNNLAKIDLDQAAQQLVTKIRSTFVELLTEQQWKNMVETELKRFTETHREPIYAGGRETREVPSEFSKICREVFTAHIKSEVQDVLKSAEWQEVWRSNGQPEISECIKQWLTEHSQQIIQSTIQSLAGQAAQQLITSMSHR